jgi:hypothetical protein
MMVEVIVLAEVLVPVLHNLFAVPGFHCIDYQDAYQGAKSEEVEVEVEDLNRSRRVDYGRIGRIVRVVRGC